MYNHLKFKIFIYMSFHQSPLLEKVDFDERQQKIS